MKITKKNLRRIIREALMRESGYYVGSGLAQGPHDGQSKDPVANVAAVVQTVVDAGKGLWDMVPYLQDAGFVADATTSPIPMVTAEADGGLIGVLSKKYVDDPDIIVGPYAIGKLE